MNRKFLIALIVMNLAMVALSMTIDYADFLETPAYLWLFVPICSLYPLLLVVNYVIYLWRGRFMQWLLNFTAVGIVGYAAMAFVFYPIYMWQHGFSWYEFGNIFWVLLYGSQIFVITPHLRRLHRIGYAMILAYFVAKDLLDRFSVTYSYQRYGMLSLDLQNILLAVVLILHVVAFFLIIKRDYANPS